jgi:hypothetical protein
MMPSAYTYGRTPEKRPDDDRYLNGRTLQKMTGVTARQLQHWRGGDFVSPRSYNGSFYYSLEDSVVVLVLAFLRQRGVPLQRLYKPSADVRRFLNAGEIRPVHLVVTTLNNSELVASVPEILKFSNHWKTGVFVLPVGEFVARVREEIRHAPITQ